MPLGGAGTLEVHGVWVSVAPASLTNFPQKMLAKNKEKHLLRGFFFSLRKRSPQCLLLPKMGYCICIPVGSFLITRTSSESWLMRRVIRYSNPHSAVRRSTNCKVPFRLTINPRWVWCVSRRVTPLGVAFFQSSKNWMNSTMACNALLF